MINIMSGSNVTLNYGEGIPDFIYAAFLTPVQKAYAVFHLLEQLGDTGMLIKARIFGPGSGQQKFFNAQFRQALELAGYHFHD